MEYSVITCVNNHILYDNFVKSIRKTHIGSYELISLDNFTNTYNLPNALNQGIRLAQGEIFIFCHQDVLFPPFWLDNVEGIINSINSFDPRWGVLGVMGVKQSGFFVGNIIDPHTCVKVGSLPSEVVSLDEVCLILRKDSFLQFDDNLGGYHLYGADICLQANQSGLRCYAIDAPFEHLSAGKVDNSFWEMAEKLREKWSRVKNAPHVIETTCGVFQLKSGLFGTLCYRFKVFTRKIIRRVQGRRSMASNAQ